MKTIRQWIWKNYLTFIGYSFMVAFVLFQISLYFSPSQKLGPAEILFVLLIYTCLMGGLGFYFSLKESSGLKGNIIDLTTAMLNIKAGKSMPIQKKAMLDEFSLVMEELDNIDQQYREQVLSLKKLADEKTTLTQQVKTAAIVEERQRIARELHDAVSQQIFAIQMMAAAASKDFDSDVNLSRQQLTEISEMAVKAQGEMRALLLHLRPVHLMEDSLTDGLIKLLRELNEKTPITFAVSIDEVDYLTKSEEEHLFRIVQEAVSNALRHSNALTIKVLLTEHKEYVLLYVSDNGIGFDPFDKKKTTYGLIGMKERCHEIGANFSLRSKPQEGTYIEVKVPTTRRERNG